MNSISERKNKGVASVIGSVLMLFLVITLASLLFLSLYSYEEKAQESIILEEQRVQEKIVLLSLSTINISETEYLNALFINNTGTITTRIRAIYIDNMPESQTGLWMYWCEKHEGGYKLGKSSVSPTFSHKGFTKRRSLW